MTITRSGEPLHLGQFQDMHRAAFTTWLAEADRGLQDLIQQYETLRDAAKERSYDRLYREVKLTVLQDYRRFTASEVHTMDTMDASLFLREFVA